MKVLIIDDNNNNVQVIKHLSNTQCGFIKVIVEVQKIRDAVKKIEELKPDLILFDVDSENENGFDAIKKIGSHKPGVIIITKHTSYALDAIKISAIDYILKPVSIEELSIAIKKAKAKLAVQQKFNELQEKVKRLEPSFIWINDNNTSKKIDISKIEYVKADSMYCEVHLESDEVRYTTFPLSRFEQELYGQGFYRVHKSYFVNLKKVMKIESGRGGNILMKSGIELPIAYRRKANLRQELKRAYISI